VAEGFGQITSNAVQGFADVPPHSRAVLKRAKVWGTKRGVNRQLEVSNNRLPIRRTT